MKSELEIKRPWRVRVEAVQQALSKSPFDAVLTTTPSSLRWISGMTDLRWVLVTRKSALAMPSRLAVQAARSALSGAMQVCRPQPGWQIVLDEMKKRRYCRIGFEDNSMSVSMHAGINKVLSESVLSVPAGMFFEKLRDKKYPEECRAILKASEITAQVADWLPQIITIGMTEMQLAARVDSLLRLAGADSPAFDTIALSGEKTAMPHGVAGTRKIRKGDLVLVDFGAKVRGYHSDCTRTFSAGSPTNAQKQAYRLVYRAYLSARSNVKPGTLADVPWKAAQRALGWQAKYFIHGLGHGVGLEIHEMPSLSSGSRDILVVGQFVTVEPGIYIPGWGGIRLEDTVSITSKGACPVTGILSSELPVIGNPKISKGGEQ